MSQVCVLTGASGFVGGRLKQRLRDARWEVREWNRNPKVDTERFQLGQEVDPSRLKGVKALVHCAYDFGPLRRKEIFEKNVLGSEKLFVAAQAAGVERFVFISSLSAFEGCRSLYGWAKLQVEKLVMSHRACVLRPGLIYSNAPAGMFGRLARQVSKGGLVPIVSGGNQTQYLIHEEDLANLVLGCIEGQVRGGLGPISAAHPRGWQLRDILRRMAEAQGKKLTLVPVPWQAMWLGLKALETVGVRTGFRSDSLIGLVFGNPKPSFELMEKLEFGCREFGS